MKKIILLISCLIISGQALSDVSPTNSYYKALPPFLQSNNNATIYMALDYSGSMGYRAYTGTYDSNKTYYGYFDPTKKYSCTGTVTQSSKKCSGGYWYASSSGTYSGNELNFRNMSRIDILRLILTGGGVINQRCTDVDSCEKFTDSNTCNQNSLCNWITQQNQECVKVCVRWDKKGRCIKYETRCTITYTDVCQNKSSCLTTYTIDTQCNANTLCSWESGKVKTEYGQYIKYEDVNGYKDGRVEGILQGIEKITQRPKIGAVLFGSNAKVNISPSDNYSTLISTINSTIATGGTNTKSAVDTIKSYFSNTNAYVYNNTTIPCANNYAIVMSDGEWNTPNKSKSSDPLSTVDVMWSAGAADLVNNLDGNQRVKTYSVAMFLGDSTAGLNSMKHLAVYGGFEDKDGNGEPCNYPSTGFPSDKTSLTYPVPSACSEWDSDNDGNPDNYFRGDEPDELKVSLQKLFESILTEASSGTSISVLSEKRAQGTVLVQAVFYPAKKDQEGTANWVGQLYSYWAFNTRTTQNIREDTNENKILDVCDNSTSGSGDLILDFVIDSQTGTLQIDKYPSDCSGKIVDNSSVLTEYLLDNLKHLWDANSKLFTNNSRKIFTNGSDGLTEFQSSNSSKFSSYLGVQNYPGSSTVFPNNIGLNDFINYIRGIDKNGLRNRTTNRGTYKLGDIIYSSPQIVKYDNFSIVFVGANDGMLHAFRVGHINKLGGYQVAKLQSALDDPTDLYLGWEEWAFIPKNALPYLRYLSDKNYNHMYFVDLTPYIIEDNGKKILIGGMRLGGGVGCNSSNCIIPPNDTCSDMTSTNCVGLSSYFALDITDPVNPNLLWEYTDRFLGFSYSGPAYITYKEGNTIYRYLMFTSGPTNYNGDSDQALGLFILKLNDDFSINTTYKITGENRGYGWVKKSAFSSANNAFGGRLFTKGIDLDNDGDTELVFFGTNEKSGRNWQGNIYVIKIKGQDPTTQWEYEKVFNNGTSPITAKIEYMKCFGMNYIYFGTGRWFYQTDEIGQNSNDTEELYGINIDKCFTGNCNINNAKNETEACNELNSTNSNVWAWEQKLDPISTGYFKERLIADPAVSPTNNITFFSTTEPSSNICSFGGRSRVWGLNCATGGSIFTGCNNNTRFLPTEFKNTIFLQLSKGNIEAITKDSFNQNNNKTTQWFIGVTPETPPIIPTPSQKGTLILWIER